jgi:ribonuclease HI
MTGRLVIYTDGACSGNPGPGGWGAVLIYGDHRKELKGGEHETTNNRMELRAAIEALRAIKRSTAIDLYTDSKYVMDGAQQWLKGWKARGWKTAARQPVKNQDLWQEIDIELSRHDVTMHWVKGHAGNIENERADALARSGIP